MSDVGSGALPASGPGCQPSASAAEEASSRSGIPNAEIIPKLPWRDMETAPHDGTIFAVWCRDWDRPDGLPRIQFAQWLDPYLSGGFLCSPYNPNNRPFAYGWLPAGEVSAAASAIEAPSGVETGNTDSTEGESAVPEGQTPQPLHTARGEHND